MSSIQKYQDILDEYKEQIPEGLYLKMSNLNMEEARAEKKEHFYEIRYAIAYHRGDSVGNHSIDIKIKTIIKKTESRVFKKIVNKIKKDGYSDHGILVYDPCTKIELLEDQRTSTRIFNRQRSEVELDFHPVIIGIKKA